MTELYELWGLANLGNFSNDMYTYNIYLTVGLTMVISTLLWMVLFYYVVDHPRFCRGWQWCLWIFAIAGINFGTAYYISTYQLDVIYFASTGNTAPYYNEFYNFSFIAAGIALIAAFVWSIIIKWKSTNCSKTPF